MPEYRLPDESIQEKPPAAQHHEVTTPQGTQENGVEHGHEHRDLNIRALIAWFVGLFALIFATLLLLWGMFDGLAFWENRKDRLPSPMFAERREPPLPRILPNPADSRDNPQAPFTGPGEYGQQELREEERKAEALGLMDSQTGLPRIPEALATEAMELGAPATATASPGDPDVWPPQDGLSQPFPSDSSGGWNLENRLR